MEQARETYQQPELTYASPNDPKLKTVLIKSIERLSGQRKLQHLYANVLAETNGNHTFWGSALKQLQVTLNYDESQLARIPKTGPLIFIANHPYGVIDGLAICHLASRVRPNFKIVINSALCKEERVASFMLPIDFDETKEAVQTNINSKREAMALLQQDGAIIIFPAGGIATAQGPFGKVTDLEWKLFTAKMIKMTNATVIPIYFYGHNGRLFQIVSQFSLTLRLSLICHEVKKQIGETLSLTIGDPIPYADLAPIKRRSDLIDHLRSVIYDLPNQERA